MSVKIHSKITLTRFISGYVYDMLLKDAIASRAKITNPLALNIIGTFAQTLAAMLLIS